MNEEEKKVFNDIVNNDLYKESDNYIQHGDISVYEHSISVCNGCIKFAKKFNINLDYESLIRGSLLHDYFLYDWHDPDSHDSLHGFSHPITARDNALRDFGLNKKEENMILSHMFPLGKTVPKYKESIVLCLVDKYLATKETIVNSKIIKNIRRK